MKSLKVVVRSCFILLTFLCQISPAATNVVDCDVCVFGGTSGGVAAAVTAARLGKKVALVLVNNHVGGMSSGGLGVTDVGNTASIGGVSAEFYQRVGQAYGSTNAVYWFEPHVAEQTFLQMLSGANVPIYTNELLASVTMSNQVITQITMASGNVYRAREYIDTTYEGDLMAAAGVTYTVGRESSATYGESLAGIQNPGGSYSYDPYVIPGDTNSGLLPFVQPGPPGTPGQGDNRVQVYNYRLCLTQNPTNQIPITAPPGYSEAQYELFRRYLAARVAKDGSVALNQIIDVQQIIPNGKTDINANGELSTDFVGYNYTYPTNTYAGRQAIALAHQYYIQGMLYYFATSTNVPASVRTNMQTWGYAKDEFQDNGGFPYQLYVREGRRMVSDYVMQQGDALSSRMASDPISLASYTLDSHPVQRIPVGGLSRWEGSVGTAVPFPYGVSYRSIIPRVGQCQNLFCTFALSASHIGFASIRLEPAFMMTSQAAGTAAAFAIDDNVPVQQVNYQKLSAELRADKLLVVWTNASVSTNGIIIDQSDPGAVVTGSWTFGANPGGWNGNYYHDGATDKGTKSVRYTPNLPTSGPYDVFLWWVESSNRATNTPVDIIHPAGTNRVLVNQVLSSRGWFKIFSTNFNAGTNSSVTIRNDNTLPGTYCVADAVRWMPTGTNLIVPPPTVDLVASDAVAGKFGPTAGRFSLVRNGGDASLPALTVNYTVGGTATNGVDYVALPGSVTIPVGVLSTNIFITPVSNNVVSGDRTVTVTLSAATNNYTLTTLSNATVLIQDLPINDWKLANFTTGELADAQISGDSADPDGDGLSNLMEYAMGLSPKNPNADPLNPQVVNGYFTVTYSRAKSATDVTVTLQTSTDLVNWQSGPAYFQQVNVVDQGANQLITTQAATPVSSSSQAFIRFVVTRL